MPIKTFRGQIADGAVDTILLHTNNGSVGYRIVKIQLYPYKFGTEDQESTVTIFSVPQTTPSNEVDFSNQELLASACMSTDNDEQNPMNNNVVFDNMTFNQDIFVCHENTHSDALPVNYYIELEQVKLDLNENTVATLKDIRNQK
tara:strand:+ start:103 stop:537 length:435 start_codon:yes stop_codon:yes gene_type:complete